VSIVPAFNSAVWGLGAASRRFDDAADRVARDVEPEDIVEATILAPAAFAANVAVTRAADEMQGSLIDILA
jgi:hypothetical protein